jgi:flagellar biosynthesis protein FlhA
MSGDFFSLLRRYHNRNVCLSLHGQVSVWGRVADICYDGVRLTEARIGSDLDGLGSFHSATGPAGESQRETLVHMNQILAVTCLDESLPEPLPEGPPSVHRRLLVEPIELLLGSELRSLAEDGDLVVRLDDLRGQLAGELGLSLPAIPVLEHVRLPERSFLVRLRGVQTVRGTIEPDKGLALETAEVTRPIGGKRLLVNPFPQPAWWIKLAQREVAEHYGYSVLPASAVILGHMHVLFRRRAADLFGRQQLEELLDQLRLTSPALVEEVIPDLIRPRQLQKLLRALLRDHVPIRDLETILETLSEVAYETEDLDRLVERVRQSLASTLTDRYRDAENRIHAVTLDPALESALVRIVRRGPRGPVLELSPSQQAVLVPLVEAHLAELRRQGRPEVLVTSSPLRAAVRALLVASMPYCAVLSHEEIDAGTTIEVSGVVFAAKLFDGERRRRAVSEPRPQKPAGSSPAE